MRHQHTNQSKVANKSAQKEGGSFQRPHGGNLSPYSRIMHLQRTAGYQAVQRLLQSDRLQAKLAISHPQDKYEQEADRVADQVMRMPEPTVQRACAPCAAGGAPCPKCSGEKKGIVQLKAEPSSDTATVPDNFLHSLGSGRPLDTPTRAFFEPRFGHDFGHVRVHTDAQAAESARSVNALAYTVGRDMVFGAGQYAPGTQGGQRLLAHELTHVVQQGNALQESSSPANAIIQRMLACPPTLRATDPIPSGWKRYQGDPSVFHCGFMGILEDREPTADDLQNECFYDHSGILVTESHPYAGCRGTPNRYDSRYLLGIPHLTIDPGGIARAGGPAFISSRDYDVDRAISSAIQMAFTGGRVIGLIFNRAIAFSVLTGIASVDPRNWRYQGLPARSRSHLNVIGMILNSTSLNQNANTVLSNLTRRLDSFPIAKLLDDLAQDINQVLQTRGLVQRFTSSVLGELSLLHLVLWLNENGIVQYIRPPQDIAGEQLQLIAQEAH